MTSPIQTLNVRALSPRARSGILIAGNLCVPCSLGRSGRSWRKREGDGATPRGEWPLRQILVRPGIRIGCPVKSRPTRASDGWCDDPGDRNYNRPVKLPYPASHEALWRDDELYHVIVVLGFNDRPRRRGGGSAVFFHLSDPMGRPTAGCVGVSRKDMMKLLPLLGPNTRMKIW
jgi:L,D-peptidoglycan transpeptidase YkuD (ErfK/YbiS/YcfS/YnhG family)